MHTPRCVNSVEEREKTLMPRKGKGVLTKGREKEPTLGRKRERVSILGREREGYLIELQCQGKK